MALSVCLSVYAQALHPNFSPLYDVLDQTNHVFSESLSSGDDNDQDKHIEKDKDTNKDMNKDTNKDKDKYKMFQRFNACYILGVQAF